MIDGDENGCTPKILCPNEIVDDFQERRLRGIYDWRGQNFTMIVGELCDDCSEDYAGLLQKPGRNQVSR